MDEDEDPRVPKIECGGGSIRCVLLKPESIHDLMVDVDNLHCDDIRILAHSNVLSRGSRSEMP